jgi:hypothetical protein
MHFTSIIIFMEVIIVLDENIVKRTIFAKVIHDMYKVNPNAKKLSNMPCARWWDLHIIELHLRNVTKCSHKCVVVGAYSNCPKCCVIKWKFQKIMMSHVIIFEFWIILQFSLNTIKISQVLVHLHWYCDCPYAHVNGVNSNIHPIISCP